MVNLTLRQQHPECRFHRTRRVVIPCPMVVCVNVPNFDPIIRPKLVNKLHRLEGLLSHLQTSPVIYSIHRLIYTQADRVQHVTSAGLTVWEAVGNDTLVHGDLEKVRNMERFVIQRFDCNVMFTRRNLTISKHLANGRQHLHRKWDIKYHTTY